MGKATLIGVIALASMGITYALGTQRGTMQETERISEHQYEALARNAALAGYHRAKQVLVDNFSSPPSRLEGTYDGIGYVVEISKESNARATIKATAKIANSQGEEISYNVKDEYLREVVTPDEVKKYKQYGLLSEGDMTLGGDTEVGVYADGAEQNRLNANMHTNANLDVRGTAASVKGYGTYVGSANVKHDVFEPYDMEEGGDPVYQADSVDIPEMKIAEWVKNLEEVGRTVELVEGDMKINGSTDGTKDVNYNGTRENPKIYHVTGNLSVSGNVALHGYTMFLVDGNIDLSGGAKLKSGNSGYTEGDESNIAIYSNGGIDLGGSAEVWAQIFVKQTVASQKGDPHIYGNVATLGDISLNGNPQIFYREASTALAVEGLEEETRRIAYNEW